MGYNYNKDDDEFSNSHRAFSMPVIVTTAVVSGVILVILLIVLATNDTNSGKNNLRNTQMLNKLNEESTADNDEDSYSRLGKDYEQLYKDGKLRAEDLDIWDMYGGSSERYARAQSEENVDVDENPENSENPDESPQATDAQSSPEPTATPETEEDTLLEGVKENTLDFKNIQIIDNKMVYYNGSEKASKLGVMIDQDNGVIDFKLLKDNGVDFVMIKVGQRGYDSGVIKPDNNYERNIKAANDAGLPIGLYFCSRAVTDTEASEEADFCTSAAYDYSVKYPIAFVYEGELVDEARTDILDEEEKSKMLDTFCKRVALAGYTPMVYGTEDYLLNQIDSQKVLSTYDVMLNEQSLLPTYPYQFKMWRYITNQVIPGIERGGDYVISFVNYADR